MVSVFALIGVIARVAVGATVGATVADAVAVMFVGAAGR